MSLIIQQVSLDFFTRVQFQSKKKRQASPMHKHFSSFGLVLLLLFCCLKHVTQLNPETRRAEIDIIWEELQGDVDTRRGRIHGNFYNLFRELISMGTTPTIITGLQRIVMTQPFKILVFPSLMYYSIKCPLYT